MRGRAAGRGSSGTRLPLLNGETTSRDPGLYASLGQDVPLPKGLPVPNESIQSASYFRALLEERFGPHPAGRRRYEAGALEFPVSPGSLPQHLSSVSEQIPAKDGDEGRAHETGAAPTGETVVVSDEDYEPHRHRGPIDNIKCGDGVIDGCPRQVIT